MRRLAAILAVLAAVPAGAAFADDDCFVPMADWQPREAVARLAADRDWTVRRIKIDDGCYEVKGTDAAGRPIKAKVDPGTLEVIELEYRDGHDRERRGRRDGPADMGRTGGGPR